MGGVNNITNTQEWYAQEMTKKRRRMVAEGRRGTKGQQDATVDHRSFKEKQTEPQFLNT